MTKMMNNISNPFKSISKTYNKISIWGKVLIFIVLLLLAVTFFKSHKRKGLEGFEQNDKFLIKSGDEVYDDFYSDIYDHLVYNNVKDSYEVGEIINKTVPTEQSIILDVGCGTGHHVADLASKNFNVVGIDNSVAMIKKAQEYYPDYDFKVGDALKSNEFYPNSFTHILCLYFTIYYMKDKILFFKNCMNWLKPGGYLVIHLVDRDMFDPILPPGNPLIMVSPQKYSKKRITSTSITFTEFKYDANFNLDNNTDNAIFSEKFKFKDSGKIRKNDHKMYMPTHESILQMAQEVGFIVQGQVDLITVTYEYQYLYILVKPN
jgi:SAM-dependent methyltransferase